jgi:thymidylate synthase (FAD)
MPPWIDENDMPEFVADAEIVEKLYLKYLDKWALNAGTPLAKQSPERARWWLPQGTRTQLVATHNLREWRWIFKLRDSVKAHPQMQEIMSPLHKDFATRVPVIFG